ncbi:MAG: hypothetical protein ACYTKD_04810 [Planctomycetota bacterium]|jgi:hypothetical protein
MMRDAVLAAGLAAVVLVVFAASCDYDELDGILPGFADGVDNQVYFEGTGGDLGTAEFTARSDHTHSEYVLKAGDRMTGDLNMDGRNTVTGLDVPVANSDAATKLYVDTGLAAKSDTSHNHDADYVRKLDFASTGMRWAQARPLLTSAIDNFALPTTAVGTYWGNSVSSGRAAITYESTAVGSPAGWTSTGVVARRFYGPSATMLIRIPLTPSFTDNNFRIWCGFFASSPATSDTAPPNSAGFFLDPGNPVWQTVTATSGGANTATSTSVTPTPGAFYVLEVDCSTNSQVRFFIDGTLVATHYSADLPSTGADLYYYAILTRKNTNGTFDPRISVGKVFITP